MTDFNPGTVIHAAATFTLAGAAGKYDPTAPAAVWSSSNVNDKFSNQVDDAEAGTSSVDIDGSANNDGDTSIYTCTVDADRGRGKQVFAVVSETVTWKNTVEIDVDGGSIALANAAVATAKQAAVHAAGPKQLKQPSNPQ